MAEKFKFGLLCDAAPLDQIHEEWDYLEVPNALMVKPFDTDEIWEKEKANLLSAGIECLTSSHYMQFFGMMSSGPAFDLEQQRVWADRGFRRMKELGIEVVGVYGNSFVTPEGYPEDKAYDDAICFTNMLADCAEKYDMEIALEPMADLDTMWPRYLDGIEFAKKVNRRSVKVMADLNYFYKLDQPLEDIYTNPELCINCHIAGSGGAQPNVGTYENNLIRLFEILKDIGYTRGVTAACPWVPTKDGELDWAYETEKTIKYLKKLRDDVYDK